MKKLLITTCIAMVMCLFAIDASAQRQGPEKTKVLLADSTQQLSAYPMDVLAIITNKCIGCHSPTGKSEKARDALQWVQLQYADPADLIAKLDEMQEVLNEGKMPPEKMIERFPNLKLTDEETSLLKEWAEATITGALGE